MRLFVKTMTDSVMWTGHTRCYTWKTLLKEKLQIFHTTDVLCVNKYFRRWGLLTSWRLGFWYFYGTATGGENKGKKERKRKIVLLTPDCCTLPPVFKDKIKWYPYLFLPKYINSSTITSLKHSITYIYVCTNTLLYIIIRKAISKFIITS